MLTDFWLFCLCPFDLLAAQNLLTKTFNFSAVSVADEGYFRNASCTLNLISTLY